MFTDKLNSVVLGRAAGTSLGVSDSDLGRLTVISYVIGNPILAVLAARSMAAADGGPKEPDPLEKAVEEAKAAAADAGDAKKAAADSQAAADKAAVLAGASQQAAAASEANAKGAAEAAQKSATAAQGSAADAKKSAEAAQQAAAGKSSKT
jgi:hypothetical protein